MPLFQAGNTVAEDSSAARETRATDAAGTAAELEHQRDLTRHLRRLAQAITESDTLDQLARGLLELVLEICSADGAVIRLRESEQLRVRSAIGIDEEVARTTLIPIPAAFDGLTPHARGALFVGTPGAACVGPGIRAQSPETVWGVPLRTGENLVAAVYLCFQRETEPRPEQLEPLAAISTYAAAALSRKQAVETLEQAIQTREDLLAVVAHDLRNPLNVISVSAGSLMQRTSDPSWLRPIERILRATHRADRLIRDLLDVNAIESGRFSIQRRRVDPCELLLHVFESQQGLAADASVILDSDLSPELPPIEADEERMLEVMENLISNAVKFTDPRKRVTVGATTNGDELHVWVKDEGRGIPSEQIPRLFDRFWQGGPHNRRGTGLGLTISKAIVEAHGGRIWAESDLGLGTTVTLSLPIADGAVPTAAPQPISNILLVDDRPENLLALKSILQSPGYRLVTATSGEEALRLALRERFDVALIDVAMPGMDGVEVASHLRALERCRDIPILFVTAFGNDPVEVQRAYAAGGADYLVKPLNPEIVRKKVAVFAGLRRRRERGDGL